MVLPLAGRLAMASKSTWSSETPLEMQSLPNPNSSTSPVLRSPSLLPFRHLPPPREFRVPSFYLSPADSCNLSGTTPSPSSETGSSSGGDNGAMGLTIQTGFVVGLVIVGGLLA